MKYLFISYIFNSVELEPNLSHSSFSQYLVKSIRAFETSLNISNFCRAELRTWNLRLNGAQTGARTWTWAWQCSTQLGCPTHDDFGQEIWGKRFKKIEIRETSTYSISRKVLWLNHLSVHKSNSQNTAYKVHIYSQDINSLQPIRKLRLQVATMFIKLKHL